MGYQPFSASRQGIETALKLFAVDRSPRLFGHQCNGIDVASVIGFAAMGGAAVTEKPRRVRVSAGIEVFDLRQAGAAQPRRDVAGQVEQRMARTRRRRKE